MTISRCQHGIQRVGEGDTRFCERCQKAAGRRPEPFSWWFWPMVAFEFGLLVGFVVAAVITRG